MKHLIKPDRISYFGPLPRVDNYLVQINSEVWIVNNIDYPLETCLNHSDAGLWSFCSHLAFPTSSPIKTKNVCEYDFKSDRKSLLRALFTVMFRTCIYIAHLCISTGNREKFCLTHVHVIFSKCVWPSLVLFYTGPTQTLSSICVLPVFQEFRLCMLNYQSKNIWLKLGLVWV